VNTGVVVHRLLLVVSAAALIAPIADAQIIPVPRRSSIPVAWGTLSAGFLQVDRSIVDGRTQSIWDFGSTLQYRGSLEMDIGNAGSIGLAAGFANAPLTYRGTSITVPGACSGGCDAHAQIWSLVASFHMGGGIGFHQIIDISAGTTVYRDFTRDSDDLTLAPESPDSDISLAIGYGFGWGFNSRMQLMLVQDASYTMHQRDGLSGGQSSNVTFYTTRLGLRVGLGSKAR
jgi:hypothetical protein